MTAKSEELDLNATHYSSANISETLYKTFGKLDYAPIKPGTVELMLDDVTLVDHEGMLIRKVSNASRPPWGRINYFDGMIEKAIALVNYDYAPETSI